MRHLLKFIPVLALTAAAAGAETYKEVRADGIAQARIEIVGGSITVKPDASLAPGQAYLRYSVEDSSSCNITQQSYEGQLRLKVHSTSYFAGWLSRGCENQVELHTSPQLTASLSSVSGRIEIEEGSGPTSVNTVTGAIVNHSNAALNLRSVNGSITSASALPPNSIKSVNGQIWLTVKGQTPSFKKSIELESVNGYITVRAAKSIRLQLVNNVLTGGSESLQSGDAGQASELKIFAEARSGRISVETQE